MSAPRRIPGAPALPTVLDRGARNERPWPPILQADEGCRSVAGGHSVGHFSKAREPSHPAVGGPAGIRLKAAFHAVDSRGAVT